MDTQQLNTFCVTAILDMEGADYIKVSNYAISIGKDENGNDIPWYTFAYSTWQNDCTKRAGNTKAQEYFMNIMDNYYAIKENAINENRGKTKEENEEEILKLHIQENDILATTYRGEAPLDPDQLKIVREAVAYDASHGGKNLNAANEAAKKEALRKVKQLLSAADSNRSRGELNSVAPNPQLLAEVAASVFNRLKKKGQHMESI